MVERPETESQGEIDQKILTHCIAGKREGHARHNDGITSAKYAGRDPVTPEEHQTWAQMSKQFLGVVNNQELPNEGPPGGLLIQSAKGTGDPSNLDEERGKQTIMRRKAGPLHSTGSKWHNPALAMENNGNWVLEG